MNTTNCLRCNRLCQTGTPDPKARMIRHSASDGFCPDCIITKCLRSIEAIENIIGGTPACGTSRGLKVPAREGIGPQALLLPHLRKNFQSILGHTQMREEDINWPRVVENWDLPWPNSRGPRLGANY